MVVRSRGGEESYSLWLSLSWACVSGLWSSPMFLHFSSPHLSSVQSLHPWGHSLRPHGLPHSRLPCPSPTPGACSNSSPLSQWCHPTISSSVIPFSCLQSFPTSGSSEMSQFFESGSPSIGVSASASFLPMNTQDWFPLGWTGFYLLTLRPNQMTPVDYSWVFPFPGFWLLTSPEGQALLKRTDCSEYLKWFLSDTC